MKPVGADHEIEPLRRSSFEGDCDAGVILLQRRDRVIIEIRRGGLAGAQQQPGEIVAQNLDVAAVQPTGADRALLGAGNLVAVDVEHRHVLEARAHGKRAVEQPHFPHDRECGAADVDGLPAGARRRRAFDHGDFEAAPGKPVGHRGPGYACAANEHLGHASCSCEFRWVADNNPNAARQPYPSWVLDLSPSPSGQTVASLHARIDACRKWAASGISQIGPPACIRCYHGRVRAFIRIALARSRPFASRRNGAKALAPFRSGVLSRGFGACVDSRLPIASKI
jgi:hypothetical protein